MNNLKKYLITGLVVVIPFSLTIYLLAVVFRFLDNILGIFLVDYLKNSWGFYVPGIGFLLFALLILLVGMLATKFLKHRIFLNLEKWFGGLPLIKNIYPAIKQIILFVSAQKEFGFKKVVLVEYPSKGIWSLGFITNEGFESLNRAINKDAVAVFVPMSPGPLSGYVILVSRKEIKFPDMSVNEALNIIISAGVFNPKN